MTEESVEIPGVMVSASIQADGEPMVFITTSGDGKTATIHVHATDKVALCALLGVLRTTLEATEEASHD